ncbi:MAG TPA: GntR family transcriptional regulator [Halanaerobiales bacterium]|nr:GntR family transcriptional regulator [Halanaerobiales bacterium]
MNIDFNASKPIYEQVIEEIKKQIARGEIKPGDKLPSQRELAKDIQVNPNTIQRAYREMEILDLVETKRGRGTFIKDDDKVIKEINKQMAQSAVQKFIDEMVSIGFEKQEIVELLKREFERRIKND